MGSGELCDGGTITEGRGGTVVRSAGEGMAPCILLHGFAQTPASWDAVAQRLQAAGHRTYAPDLYECKGDLKLPSIEEVLEGTEAGEDGEDGEGVEGDANAKNVSGAVRDPLTSLDAACDRVAAIVRLVAQVDAAPVLVGYSMGGRIVAETVVRYPNLPLAGLVLESAGLGPADEAARAALAERNGAWAQRLRDEGVAAFMDWWETLPLFASQRGPPTPPSEPSAPPAMQSLWPALWKLGVLTIKLPKRLRLASLPTWPTAAFRCSTLPASLMRSTPR